MKHPIIVENLMGIKRVKGSIQKGKKPILINHLKSIINVIDEQKIDEIKKLRDNNYLNRLWRGFRRTELISIDHEDLEFVPEGLKITIKRSKTDQFGEGMIKGLPYFTNEVYCPVVNLKNWLEISNIKSGPIFRRFSKGSSLTNKRLTDQSVVLLMKEYLNLAGIENKIFAGHSLRSGFATVAAESGADERSIMAMTGHKTTQMVRRYIREANIFKNNALNKLKYKKFIKVISIFIPNIFSFRLYIKVLLIINSATKLELKYFIYFSLPFLPIDFLNFSSLANLEIFSDKSDTFL